MSNKTNNVGLEDLLQKVYKKLWFPRSLSVRMEFCINLCTVALGIRTGYLIDKFSPKEGRKEMERLLEALRKEDCCFEDLRLVYSSESQQYFFINMQLLRQRLGFLDNDYVLTSKDFEEENIAFVLLDRTEILIDPPSDVVQTLKCIGESSDDPIQLPEGLTPETLIPLSGFLLEYPVAYVPSSPDSASFLHGIPLDVYECIITTGDQSTSELVKRHTLLKFSCPVHISASGDSLAPRSIIDRLERRFHSRLKATFCTASLTIIHSVITQDRVAL